MNAKHSALLLSGLLLLMIAAALAQTPDPVQLRPTCPRAIYEANVNYANPYGNVSKWVRADWNAKADRWEIDCDSEMPSMHATNSANATNTAWPRTSSDHNTMTNSASWNVSNANANMPARNATNVRPPRSVRREPNTRRPGN